MTNDKEKERLKEKFNNLFLRYIIPYNQRKEMGDSIFDFFYSEIEAREKRIENLTGLFEQGSANIQTLLTRMSQLESIIQAADEMVYQIGSNGNMGYYEALEKYNSLKGKI